MGLCPRCGDTVELGRGRPFVTTTGAVELWHEHCWDVRDTAVPVAPVEPIVVVFAPSPPRHRRWIAGAAIGSSLLGLAVARASIAQSTSLANVDVEDHESVRVRTGTTVREIAPPPIDPKVQYEVPLVNGDRLDELYPSLLDWIHPVTGAPELMPDQASRHFGAERTGITLRPECGQGHCGVDLEGPRGRPVVAVADGVVVRAERSELGLDGRSGRYVRIEHDDGTLTAYMHLDEVAEGLEVGDHVDGGQYIGTLGATAVFSAPPHLHFTLEVPNHFGDHGDNTNTHFVDPAPFLVRASVAPVPERKHALKPAM
jgi:murein DD-endopeptidase MepM/ murein hydrolase activator NlpD